MSSRSAPFSVIYFQVVEVTGASPARYLARYVGPAGAASGQQAELFVEPAFVAPKLEALDVHVLPAWVEQIEPPAWLKRLLTPPAWSWRDLPPRTLDGSRGLQVLKEEFGLSGHLSAG